MPIVEVASHAQTVASATDPDTGRGHRRRGSADVRRGRHYRSLTEPHRDADGGYLTRALTWDCGNAARRHTWHGAPAPSDSSTRRGAHRRRGRTAWAFTLVRWRALPARARARTRPLAGALQPAVSGSQRLGAGHADASDAMEGDRQRCLDADTATCPSQSTPTSCLPSSITSATPPRPSRLSRIAKRTAGA